MRLLGLILSLGAIVWVLYQAAGGKDAETVIPESYQESMKDAKSVEQALQDSLIERMDPKVIEEADGSP